MHQSKIEWSAMQRWPPKRSNALFFSMNPFRCSFVLITPPTECVCRIRCDLDARTFPGWEHSFLDLNSLRVLRFMRLLSRRLVTIYPTLVLFADHLCRLSRYYISD